MTFLKNLFLERYAESEVRAPQGRRSLSGRIEIPGGKGFRVLREDILQKGLSRRRTKEAA
jgi:hypothetical protein